jgi:phage FluMu protein Com
MWLKCTSCGHKLFGAERDWGKPCPNGDCEGTLAFEDGYQRFYPVRRPNYQILTRTFICDKCHNVFRENQLSGFAPWKCPQGSCSGKLFPI